MDLILTDFSWSQTGATLILWYFPEIEDNITNLKTALTVTKSGYSPQLCH